MVRSLRSCDAITNPTFWLIAKHRPSNECSARGPHNVQPEGPQIVDIFGIRSVDMTCP